MKRQLISIALVFIACFLVFYLYINKDEQKNGFNRTIAHPEIISEYAYDLTNRSFLFSGNSTNNIILSSYKKPFVIYSLDNALRGITEDSLTVPKVFDADASKFKFEILDNKAYLSDYFGHFAVLNGKSLTTYSIPLHNTDQTFFISDSSFVIRSIEQKEKQPSFQLAKFNALKSEIKKYKLPIYRNGLFGSDGWLEYDRKLSRFIYTYYYIGEFLCLDTNLNLIYKQKTIDTITTPVVQLGVYKTKLKNGSTGDLITPIKPPKFVNKMTAVDNGLLYVLSALKSDNQSKSDYRSNQIVDVYSVQSGKYIHSFNVPNYKNHKLRQFVINDNLLIGMFDKFLVKIKIIDT